MSSDPTSRNRLDEEASPYLRQHADNPVNWQPWDETALAAAREQDKPVFLSIGYAACHWDNRKSLVIFDQDSDYHSVNHKTIMPVRVVGLRR